MPPRLLHPDHYELLERNSSDLDGTDFQSQRPSSTSYVYNRPLSFPKFLLQFIFLRLKAAFDHNRFRKRYINKPRNRRQSFVKTSRRICCPLIGILVFIYVFAFLLAIFRPSYTKQPTHYQLLESQILQSKRNGRGNPENLKIFIAASIYDKGGRLVKGNWGKALLQLIDLLGNDNVFLSIYENDGGPDAQAALEEFKGKVQCAHSLVFEEHLPLINISHITLSDGSERVKRIAYLAEVRNRALRPLDEATDVKFDRILFFNDVVFDPIDAVQLLFSTHANDHGKADYLAACAVDFINPFKFYDTFATRDLEGYSMGVPFFPWFSSAGKGISRHDVLDGTDAVRVKSCWGGMVAFDAHFFQASIPTKDVIIATTLNHERDIINSSEVLSGGLLRFRAEPDLYWEASECCLIHADLLQASKVVRTYKDDGIFLNPFIRVAYDNRTFRWLRFTRRFERLYTTPHYLINLVVGLPWFNPRRTEQEGTEINGKAWVPDSESNAGGSFQEMRRVAGSGGYCGMRALQVIKERPQNGEKNWETMPLPPG